MITFWNMIKLDLSPLEETKRNSFLSVYIYKIINITHVLKKQHIPPKKALIHLWSRSILSFMNLVCVLIFFVIFVMVTTQVILASNSNILYISSLPLPLWNQTIQYQPSFQMIHPNREECTFKIDQFCNKYLINWLNTLCNKKIKSLSEQHWILVTRWMVY